MVYRRLWSIAPYALLVGAIGQIGYDNWPRAPFLEFVAQPVVQRDPPTYAPGEYPRILYFVIRRNDCAGALHIRWINLDSGEAVESGRLTVQAPASGRVERFVLNGEATGDFIAIPDLSAGRWAYSPLVHCSDTGEVVAAPPAAITVE